jgi:hypothetical protein
MTSLFLTFNEADATGAASQREALQSLGYRVVQPPADLSKESVLYPRAVDTGVLGSAVVVVLWSAHAARDAWVERAALVAGRLGKAIVVVRLDATPFLPVLATAPAAAEVEALRDHLPAPDADTPLLLMAELLAHDHIRERRKGIEQARELLADLAQRAQRETVQAWLEYMARHDSTDLMRELAQSVLKAHAGTPPQPTPARYRIGVRCAKGHVSWFDKRRLCSDHTTFTRTVARRADANLSEIAVRCGEPGCGEVTKVSLDCEEY